jgi:hypothetical protein
MQSIKEKKTFNQIYFLEKLIIFKWKIHSLGEELLSSVLHSFPPLWFPPPIKSLPLYN